MRMRTYASGSCPSSATSSGARSGRAATFARIPGSGWRASRATAGAGVCGFRVRGSTVPSAKHRSTSAGDRAHVPSTCSLLSEPMDGSSASTRSGSSTQPASRAASRTAGSGSSRSPARSTGVSDCHRQVARIGVRYALLAMER
ncbi:hypothetical protein SNARM312S_03091 [Streptomyces narbonensis]